jgi:hypothetical protein
VLAATRYFLVSAGDCLERLAATTGTGERLSPPLDAGPLSGTVIVPRAISPELAAVELATAGGAPFASDVRFELFLGETRVAASVVPGRSVQNTGATRFPLALSAPLAPGTYRYVITVLQPGGGRLSARTFASGGPYSVGGTETPGTPRVQFLRSKSPDGLVLHQPGQNVIVAENPAVSGGAYFVRSLDPDAAVDFSRVHVNAHRPADFQLRYEGTAPGFVVVPMRTSGDWVATVNGTPADIAAFHDVFTAVAVDGPADIHLRFATGALAASAVAGWTAAVLLLVGAALTSRRLRTSAAGRA